MFVFLFVLLIWVYTAPRSIHFAGQYLAMNLEKALPHGIKIYFDDTILRLDNDFKLRIDLGGFKVHAPGRSVFTTTGIGVVLDPLGLFPQTHHKLWNVAINDPKIIQNSIQSQNESAITIKRLRDYVEEHAEALLKFGIILQDLKLSLDLDHGKVDLNINTLSLQPYLTHSGHVLFESVIDLSIGHYNNIIEATIDTSDPRYLRFEGTAQKISASTLQALGLDNPMLQMVDFDSDIKFKLMMSSLKTVESASFQISKFNGLLKSGEIWEKDLRVHHLSLNGHCTDNCSKIVLEKLDASIAGFQIHSHMEYVNESENQLLTANFSTNSLEVNKLASYWPKLWAERTRSWILENVHGGLIASASGTIKLDLLELAAKRRNNSEIDINLHLHDTNISYMDHSPAVEDVDADIKISLNDVKFDIRKGFIDGVAVEKARGVINDIGTANAVISVTSSVVGDAQDLVLVALKHVPIKLPRELENLHGNAEVDVTVRLPIDDNILFQDISIIGKGIVRDMKYSIPGSAMTLKNGEMVVSYDKNILTASGEALLAGLYRTSLDVRYDVIKNNRKIKMSTELETEDLPKLGLHKPDFLGKKIGVVALEDETGLELDLDLQKTSLSLKRFGIEKKVNAAGKAVFHILREQKGYKISNYEIYLPQFSSVGSMNLDKQFQIIKLQSPKTLWHQGEFALTLERNAQSTDINISGPKLDVSPLKMINSDSEYDATDHHSSTKNQPSYYHITTKVDAFSMSDGAELKNMIGNFLLRDNDLQKGDLLGHWDNGIQFNAQLSDTKLLLASDDAGKTLSFLGVTKKIRKGQLLFEGSLHGTSLKGMLQIQDCHMRKAPVLAKLLSLLSITSSIEGIASMFDGKGTKFKMISCPIEIKKGVLSLDHCYADGPSLGITADGTANFHERTLSINGVIAPRNLLDTALSLVPFVGSALKENKESFISTPFTIRGTFEDPQAEANPLSMLIPIPKK